MYDDFIKFSNRKKDLDTFSESWKAENYRRRLRKIQSAIKKETGVLPSVNMRPIREGVFHILPETTLDDVVALRERIRRHFIIDCFQVSIDRDTQTAHLLFDFNDPKTLQSVYINRPTQIKLSVLIIRTLNLPRPEGSELWLRAFLSSEYNDDSEVFNRTLKKLKHLPLGQRSFRVISDALVYVHNVCKGILK